MASIKGAPGRGINFDTLSLLDFLNGATGGTPTGFILPDGSEIIGQNFTYDGNGNPISGIVREINIVTNGSLLMTIASIEMPIQTLRGFTQDVTATRFLAAVLAGNDKIGGNEAGLAANVIDGFMGNDSIDGA